MAVLIPAALLLVLAAAEGAEAPPSPPAPAVSVSACATDNTSRGSVHGDSGNDTILYVGGTVHGDEDDDRIFAGDKPIQAFGDDDQDLVDGGPKNDVINGGRGRDILMGELGADRFVYEQRRDSQSNRAGGWSTVYGDTIVDFTPTDGDKIDLSKLPKARADRPLRWSGHAPRPYGVWTAPRYGDTVVFVEATGDRRADVAIRLLGPVSLARADFCGVE